MRQCHFMCNIFFTQEVRFVFRVPHNPFCHFPLHLIRLMSFCYQVIHNPLFMNIHIELIYIVQNEWISLNVIQNQVGNCNLEIFSLVSKVRCHNKINDMPRYQYFLIVQKYVFHRYVTFPLTHCFDCLPWQFHFSISLFYFVPLKTHNDSHFWHTGRSFSNDILQDLTKNIATCSLAWCNYKKMQKGIYNIKASLET